MEMKRIFTQAHSPDQQGLFGEWKGDLPEFGKILAIGAQLLLLVLIIRLFNIQDAAFQNLSMLILGAFFVNALLPQRWRLGFFTLFSVASIGLILGPIDGAWVLGIGGLLITVSLLPVAFALRVGLIGLIGAGLVALRLEWISAPWEAAVWQILGAMFMFRLIIYLYDIKHDKRRPALLPTLSYFFMVPNVCFPLFPVVDYKKFQRSHYSAPACDIYQRGISWIFRGVLHLLLYRLVYQYLTIDPVEVNGLLGVLHFSFSAFGLYLQVSGLFHMIVGILLLFGFNLPETNHLYFLASSFNDFWRRINIYWKDFMMKVFYYPVYFKLRKLGETQAIILSTMIVFFATWFLHAYQWFWLRGVFLLEWHDALYWAVLAVLVILNSLYESKYGRERSLGGQSRSWLDHASTVLSTMGTFLTLGLLWGMWSSDSMGQWVQMWSTTGEAWLGTIVLIPLLFAASWGVAQLAKQRHKTDSKPLSRFWRPALGSALVMGMVYTLGHSAVYSQLPKQAVSALDSIRVVGLSKRDQHNLERGYYENLVEVNRHTQLWDLYDQRPADWGQPSVEGVFVKTNDFLGKKHAPNVEFMFKKAKMSTNQWGMRDKHYELRKPKNTIRIALLGASHVIGTGVNDDETFEAILEKLLNREFGGEPCIEILNFAYNGRTVIRQVTLLEKNVIAFQPDIVFYVGHKNDDRRVSTSLARLIRSGTDVPYAGLRSIIKQADINKDWDSETMKRRAYPFGNDILNWAYQRLVKSCLEQGVLPMYIFLPMTYERLKESDTHLDISMAKSTGFSVLNLREVYNKHDPETLYVAKWDKHPNAKAHKLIATYLFDTMITRKNELLLDSKDRLLAIRDAEKQNSHEN